jgi:hypothetical protein
MDICLLPDKSGIKVVLKTLFPPREEGGGYMRVEQIQSYRFLPLLPLLEELLPLLLEGEDDRLGDELLTLLPELLLPEEGRL